MIVGFRTRASRGLFHLAVAAAGSVPVQAQTPAAPVRPPAAYSVGAFFEDDRGRLVIFGGYAGGALLGNTWEWDGAAWSRTILEGPSARNHPVLVYDSRRRRGVLFGGDAGRTGDLGDTWTFDGTSWQRVATTGPGPRTVHAMAYDAGRDRVVLFGGAARGSVLGDTWEWDGSRWALADTTGPAPRALHGMAYDPARGKVVLFGGTAALTPGAPALGDTWEWDGKTWRRMTMSGPGPRDHVALAWDALHRVTLLHGGGPGVETSDQTWLYDGTAWQKQGTTGPRRQAARLVFDSRAGRILLFGGFDQAPSNELWSWDGRIWKPTP